VLLEAEQLPPAFFDLRSGFAGEFLQKLQNYQLRVAAVFPTDGEDGNRFREFMAEATLGRTFRVSLCAQMRKTGSCRMSDCGSRLPRRVSLPASTPTTRLPR
jgi:hypothetical protein